MSREFENPMEHDQTMVIALLDQGKAPCGQLMGSMSNIILHVNAKECPNQLCIRTTITEEVEGYVIRIDSKDTKIKSSVSDDEFSFSDVRELDPDDWGV